MHGVQGTLKIDALQLRTWPEMEQRLIHGRDVQLFPGLELSFFTLGNLLLPVERGQMVHDRADRQPASYWRVIPETGRVWRQPEDGDWSRAAFPLMLVNDTENQAHQGLAQFLYRPGRVSALAMQFVQQSAPYLIKPCFVAWGCAQAQLIQSGVAISTPSAPARTRNSPTGCRHGPGAISRIRCRRGHSMVLVALSLPNGKSPPRWCGTARFTTKRP